MSLKLAQSADIAKVAVEVVSLSKFEAATGLLSCFLWMMVLLRTVQKQLLHMLNGQDSNVLSATVYCQKTSSRSWSVSGDSSLTMESEEDEVDHHLLTAPNSDVTFLQDTPLTPAKDLF
ncbi:hypothetical protein L1987_03531 [Smallanthus sonchifolius]|uniref:Uncharacterized protein n=1 Tax=Smallanthus sonchifolius TaxID=185202 RepID=A0ACB9KAZ6_9ASTR|nr:hypothetical protein L1987_03531 [Smallanthus sonchifolius]